MFTKKIILVFITTILLVNLAHAQSDWVNYKVGDKLSVKVPEQPVKLDENSVIVRAKDSLIYIVAIVDFSKTDGLDSAAMASRAPTTEFAKNFKDGMQGEMPGFTMGDVSIGKWKGYTSYNIDGDNPSKNMKIYTYMVFIGHNVYSLMVLVSGNTSTKGRDAFFASLALN